MRTGRTPQALTTRLVKRAIDVTGAAAALVLAVPVFAVTAVLISGVARRGYWFAWE